MKMFFAFLLTLVLVQNVFGRELLVAQAPTYNVGDGIEATFETILGDVYVAITYKGECQLRRDPTWYRCADISVEMPGVGFRSVRLATTPDWRKTISYFEGVTYRFETEGSMFPLYEGDVRRTTVLSSQPCRKSRYQGQTCMEVDGTDTCSNFRRVSNGIEFTCQGVYGRSRVVMDHDFKVPLSFEFLEQ